MMAAVGAVLSAMLVLGYPVLIYWGMLHLSPGRMPLVLGGAAVVIILVRMPRATRRELGRIVGAPLLLAAAALAAWALGDNRPLLLFPIGVNAAFLLWFGTTLFSKQPIVERFARLQHPDLSPDEVRYCRTVTMVWCVFFIINGSVAAALAAWAPISWWAAYTGLIAYILMGTLGASELMIRKWRFQRFDDGVVDRILGRWLQRRSTTSPPA